jgi:hypothetical protein
MDKLQEKINKKIMSVSMSHTIATALQSSYIYNMMAMGRPNGVHLPSTARTVLFTSNSRPPPWYTKHPLKRREETVVPMIIQQKRKTEFICI